MERRPGFTRAEAVLISGAAAVVFTRVFAFSLVLPGFREFGDGLDGASDLLVGAALGAYGLTMAASQFVLGALSDRWGRKPILLVGSAFFVAGSIGCALADSIWLLLAARLVQGFGGVSSVAMAAVGETVPEERRTSAMAFIGIPAGLGFFLGFAAGPFVADLLGFRALFWATAVLGVAAVLPMIALALPPPRPAQGIADGRGLTLPIVALALSGFSVNFAMNEVAFFLPDVPIGRGGLMVVLVVALAGMLVASKAIDRRRATHRPILIALATLAGGASVFVTSTSLMWAVVGGVAFFGAHAILSAVLPSQVSRIAGRSGGRGHGIQLVVAYLGSAAGGVAAGALADHAAIAALVAAGACAVAATLVTIGLRPAAVAKAN